MNDDLAELAKTRPLPVFDLIDRLLEVGRPTIASSAFIEKVLSHVEESDDASLCRLELSKHFARKFHNREYAIQHATQIVETFEAAEARIAIVESFLTDTQLAIRLLDETTDLATKLDEPWQAAEILNKVARTFVVLGEREKAIAVWINAAGYAREGIGLGGQSASDSLSVLREMQADQVRLGFTYLVEKSQGALAKVKDISPKKTKKDGA